MILPSALLSIAMLAAPGDTCSSSTTTAAAHGQKSILETATAAGSFNTLAAALKAADLIKPLEGEGPFTVFAPTDAAFAKLDKKQLESLLKPENKGLLGSILTYHVVAGNVDAKHVVKSDYLTTLNGQRIDIKATDSGVMIDGAKVVTTDIECSNGTIHVIDTVILPATEDIVQTAVNAGSFKTLASLLQSAHLVEALQGEGPFTVFAPTDEAFATVDKGTLAELGKPENREQLAAVLKFHVVPGRIYADQVIKGAELKTLQGHALEARSHDKGVLVNGARVVQADIETTNGVIHVIDGVLIPE